MSLDPRQFRRPPLPTAFVSVSDPHYHILAFALFRTLAFALGCNLVLLTSNF
jgi:hypothetical protein